MKKYLLGCENDKEYCEQESLEKYIEFIALKTI